MVSIFHCYEFLLLRKLDHDPDFWVFVKDHAVNEKKFSVQNVPPHLWFLIVTVVQTDDRFPSFVKTVALQNPDYVPSVSDCLLGRYLKYHTFVELHLDSIFRHGEGGVLPKELFKCSNVEFLSLRCNFLEVLPPEVAQLQKLKYLALTNNRLQNSSIPFCLVFCRRLNVLLLDNNLLDALPGFLLRMPNLTTVHRHGNHNYFKSTFMWYHTDVNYRILPVQSVAASEKPVMKSLLFLCAAKVIAAKLNFFASPCVPQMLVDYLCSIYFDFNVCYNCCSAIPKYCSGYKVFTFKNPYLGLTCVPFQHWACSLRCAEEIEFPARVEQLLSAREQDRQYAQRVREAHDRSLYSSRDGNILNLSCRLL